MTDPLTADTAGTAGAGVDAAKGHFGKAVEEALAGAQALGKEAQARAGEYADKLGAKREGLTGDARVKGDEYKEKAFAFANDGKAKTSQALTSFGQLIEDNAGLIDDKVGARYGDYARSAAGQVKDAATKLDEKSLDELGEEAKEFVRQSPALAVGLAAAAGYMVARIFRR